MNEQMIEEMLKLDIEESVSGYSAFINDMRISKSKPFSVSKTIMSFDCPKKYIYEAIGIPENMVVLTRKEYDELLSRETRAFIKGEKQGSKETAEKVMNDISSDIIVVNTKEYGNVEVVPVERLQEICTNLIERN